MNIGGYFLRRIAYPLQGVKTPTPERSRHSGDGGSLTQKFALPPSRLAQPGL